MLSFFERTTRLVMARFRDRSFLFLRKERLLNAKTRDRNVNLGALLEKDQRIPRYVDVANTGNSFTNKVDTWDGQRKVDKLGYFGC